MKPVVGYFRVSQARDGMKAPNIYTEQIERYCVYKDLALSEIYSDIDYSAFRGAKARPGLERLKQQRTEFSAVIVPKLSRFGRSMKDLVALFDLFDHDGIALVFLDLNIDTSTSQGRLLRNVMAAFAEYESDVKSDYSRASHRHVAELGRPVAASLYGYRYDKALKNFVVQKEEATIVRRVYELYVAGESATQIARELRTEGVPTLQGGRWTHASVVRMVDNASYAGLRAYDGDRHRASWEAIVSREQWDQAQERRSRQRRDYGPTNQRYLLSGLIVCGACGRVLHHHRYGGKSPRYVCSSSKTGNICRGGGITEFLADRLITDAYLSRVELLGAGVLGETGRDVDYQGQWETLSVERRNAILASAIERLELVDRSIRKARNQDRFRQLRLTWKEPWRLEPHEPPLLLRIAAGNSKVCVRCGYRRDMSQFLRHELPEGWCRTCRKRYRPTGSPEGRTWAEWRRERILFRPLKVR